MIRRTPPRPPPLTFGVDFYALIKAYNLTLNLLRKWLAGRVTAFRLDDGNVWQKWQHCRAKFIKKTVGGHGYWL